MLTAWPDVLMPGCCGDACCDGGPSDMKARLPVFGSLLIGRLDASMPPCCGDACCDCGPSAVKALLS